jgi:hypothetical protein
MVNETRYDFRMASNDPAPTVSLNDTSGCKDIFTQLLI